MWNKAIHSEVTCSCACLNLCLLHLHITPKCYTECLISNWRMDGCMKEFMRILVVVWGIFWRVLCKSCEEWWPGIEPLSFYSLILMGQLSCQLIWCQPDGIMLCLTSAGWAGGGRGFLFFFWAMLAEHLSNCTLCGWCVIPVLCCDLCFYELWELRTYQF